MKTSLKLALAIQVVIMIAVFIPPLLTKATGTEVYLETERVDPRALIRGDYVALQYPITDNVPLEIARKAQDEGKVVYVTVTTDRPAKYVSATLEKPELKEGQACLSARAHEAISWDNTARVVFPQIAQFFVPEGTGLAIEQDLNDMVAKAVTTKSCNTVLLSLEYL